MFISQFQDFLRFNGALVINSIYDGILKFFFVLFRFVVA